MDYCEIAPRPPRRQDRHTPNPLPFARMKLQRSLRRANSVALIVAGVKAVSVPNVGNAVGPAWSVVPQAAKPGARATAGPLTPAAELLQLPPTGTVARILMTIEVGTAGVSVLLIRSLFADRETSPLGVTGQEQHEIICSS